MHSSIQLFEYEEPPYELCVVTPPPLLFEGSEDSDIERLS